MVLKSILSVVVPILILCVVTNSCTNNKKEAILGNVCDTINTKFAAVINPIIIESCNSASGCHGGASMGSVSLEGYTNVNSNYAEILARIKSGNMPKGKSKLDDCTILKIETWINRGIKITKK